VTVAGPVPRDVAAPVTGGAERELWHAAISEPVKPITYYVDPATPSWLVPYVKQGIEDWQPAFEAAGFRRGIVAADAPSPEQDPD